jgi:hypothetical protein
MEMNFIEGIEYELNQLKTNSYIIDYIIQEKDYKKNIIKLILITMENTSIEISIDVYNAIQITNKEENKIERNQYESLDNLLQSISPKFNDNFKEDLFKKLENLN